MVYLYSTVEQNMNSTERMLYYTQLPAEGQKVTPRKPPASWPSSGAIQFAGVQFAYRHGLPLVLDGISFSVKAQEKVGIVGRTGAGKSSLLQALFRYVIVLTSGCSLMSLDRMSELQGGVIEIDGVDLQYIGLEELRQSLALVPQESVLFVSNPSKWAVFLC
jgi:ATP-binding cassette subfamily C (CFTR/MRP) protein 1